MNTALLASAALMGLAGSLHCAGMCGAVCVGVAGRCTPARPARGTAGVLAGRLLGYMLAGAVIAGFASGLRWLGEGVSWLRPFWSAAQVGLLLLGLWLLLRGRLPLAVQAWIEGLGRRPQDPAGWQRVALPGELRAAGLGLLWPAIPCGLLHAALLLASVASGPLDGAAVMAAFGLASSLGLLIAPAVWLRWLPGVLRPAAGGDASQFAVRLAGAMLVLSLGWSLGHGLLQPLQDAFCL